MSVKSEILTKLENAKGTPLSGEEMANSIGCTRAAVWKAIKELQTSGYTIEAVNNKGYTLRQSGDIISKEYIEAELKKANIEIELDVRDQVDSTNTQLKALASAGKKTDMIMISAEQTAGRGRRGRAFYSPAGSGVYISFLLHPTCDITQAANLTTLAVTAEAEAIEAVTGVPVDIKWVNDILVDGKKISGILTEASTSMEDGSLEYVVPGIGINVYAPENGFPEELKEIAGAISYEAIGSIENFKNRILSEFIIRFMKYYRDFPSPSYIESYKKRCVAIGKEVTLLTPDHTPRPIVDGQPDRTHAKVLDINEACHLLVEYNDGYREYLNSGEISIR